MLHTKKPREQNGRDSFSRFKAQIRSAAIASLSILEGKEIDWVYCDFHDDFVVRKNNNGKLSYLFYQVKTKSKQNHNWTINELIGIHSKKSIEKQDCNKIKESFIGKLLLHTIIFENFCSAVIFQTNINNSDEVEDFFDDIKNNKFENKNSKILIEKFKEIYAEDLNSEEITDENIKNKLSKIDFDTDVEYLKDTKDNFEPIARTRIYNFSEIDLSHTECKEIIIKLLELVEKKSSGIIKELSEEEIDKLAGISIEELLEILSITYDAYQILLKNGDPKAVKSASIIQRILSASGAGKETIEYCSRCKSEWDVWLRNARHSVPEFDLQMIIGGIRRILNNCMGFDNSLDIDVLKKPIKTYYKELSEEDGLYGLNQNLILGGVFAEIVKGRA
ncbi:dsDNA nuclease domain-containing protein [Acinetobacter baumannii]|nr:dsDNA nuclease domain-containing protein [Acinetobacter baumannii]